MSEKELFTSNQRLECITLPNNSVVIDGTAYDHLAQVAQENVNLRAQLSCATAELAWAEECGRKRDAGETAVCQVCKQPLAAHIGTLAPGAIVWCPAKAVETRDYPLTPTGSQRLEQCLATLRSIEEFGHRGGGHGMGFTCADMAAKALGAELKANAHNSWCLCSDCLDKRGREEAAEKTDDHRYIEALEGQLDSVGLAAAQREAGITADVSENWECDACKYLTSTMLSKCFCCGAERNASPTSACNCGKPASTPDEHWKHAESCPALPRRGEQP